MRRRKPPYDYILCFAALLALISIPVPTAMHMRGTTIAALSPTWRLLALTNPFSWSKEPDGNLKALQLENQQLKDRINLLEQAYSQTLQMALEEESETPPMAARVVYRPFDNWNHSLWVDVGWENNRNPEYPVIAKDSPVVLGNAVVGVVDCVGKRHSRVRLLTDPGVVPSVRVARGRPESLSLLYSVDELLDSVNEQPALLGQTPETRLNLLTSLETLKADLLSQEVEVYLAKGELCGVQGTQWRKHSPLLHGRGFNYDFSDAKGSSRNLRSGKLEDDPNAAPIALIRPQDLLVTTGMDGIFPPGLRVATVKEVSPLREGAYTYDLTAKPAASSLQTLTTVFILPPQMPLGTSKQVPHL
jgi:cell shape-determining protein MreC